MSIMIRNRYNKPDVAEDVEVNEGIIADGELQGIVSDIRYGSGSTPSEVDIRMTVGGKPIA